MTLPSEFETRSCLLNVTDGGYDSRWDSFLRRHDCGHHLQSSLWSEVKALRGWNARRIIAFDGEQIIGGAQLLMRKVKYIGNVGYIPKGPVLIDDDVGLAERLLEEISKIASSARLQVLFVQPSKFGAWVPSLTKRGFATSPVEIAPSATLLIDLTSDLDVILSRMPKGMRNQVRRSQKRGISVREGTKKDLPTFHSLLSATGQRQKFVPIDFDYLQGMWDILEPAGCCKLFISELEGEAVSAQFCILFGNIVVAKRIGWSGRHRHRHPNEALDWYTIQWAKNNGYRYYDLEGIERSAAHSLNSGKPLPETYVGTPTSYKLRLGGEAQLYPATYCLIANPILRMIYNRFGFKVANYSMVNKAVDRFLKS